MLYNVLWTTDAIDAIDAMICAGLWRGMLEDWGHCAARQHLAAELAARDVHLYHASEEDPVRRVTLWFHDLFLSFHTHFPQKYWMMMMIHDDDDDDDDCY